MKKFIIALALVASTTAFANGHGHYHPSYNGSGEYIAPLIIGGIIGYGMSQSQRQSETIIIQQPQPVYNNPQRVYNMTTPPPYLGATPIYQQRNQWEPSCNCYVVVYAQIGWQ